MGALCRGARTLSGARERGVCAADFGNSPESVAWYAYGKRESSIIGGFDLTYVLVSSLEI